MIGVTRTVRQLVDEGVIERPMDGNHGELHPKTSDFVPSGIPFIMASDLKDGALDLENCAFISPELASTLRKGFARTGDVLLSHKATMGRTAIVGPLNTPYVMLTPQVTYYRVLDGGRLNRTFLKCYFDSPEFQRLFSSWGDAGSTRSYLGISAQLDLPIVVPPIETQGALAEILGALDDKIRLNGKLNRSMDALSSAFFRSWFVDFDPVLAKRDGRPPFGVPTEAIDAFPGHFEDSRLGPIPRGWAAERVGDHFDVTMGQSPPGSTYNEAGDGLPFYQGRTDFGFRYPSRRVYCTAPTRFAQRGDTLISVRAPVGDANMASEHCAIGRGVAAVRHKDGKPSFTYYAMCSLRDEFDVYESEGTLFGAIGGDDFRRLSLVHPTLPILKSFEALVGPMDTQIEANERESVSLAQLRDALLGPLLSGELTIKSAEKAVGAAL